MCAPACVPVLDDGLTHNGSFYNVYLARTSFQAVGMSTACGSRSRAVTACCQCRRALKISSAVTAPACRRRVYLYSARFTCSEPFRFLPSFLPSLIAAKQLEISASTGVVFDIDPLFDARRRCLERSCSGALPSRGPG